MDERDRYRERRVGTDRDGGGRERGVSEKERRDRETEGEGRDGAEAAMGQWRQVGTERIWQRRRRPQP